MDKEKILKEIVDRNWEEVLNRLVRNLKKEFKKEILRIVLLDFQVDLILLQFLRYF